MSDDIRRIIEDYLKMVRKHLPNSNADDIISELRSHILDAAQENATGEVSSDAVWKIIGSFGAPSEVAQQYLEHDTFEPKRVSAHSNNILIIPKLQWVDVLIMVIVTFFLPFQIAYHGLESGMLYTSLDAILWGIFLTYPTSGTWYYPHPIFTGVLYGLPNIIFLIQFIRYFADKTTIKRLLFLGFCTLIIPMASFLAPLTIQPPIEFLYYTGPIPIQVAAALALLYYRGRIVFGDSSKEEIPEL